MNPKEREFIPTIKKKFSGHDGNIHTVCFSPDQTLLCSGGRNKSVIIHNLRSIHDEDDFPDPKKELTNAHELMIWMITFSSNGQLMGTSSSDKTFKIWNTSEFESLASDPKPTIFTSHTDIVLDIRFFWNDPMKVISCSRDKTLKIWDIEKQSEISSLVGEGGFLSVDILQDNQTMISGDGMNKLKIWDLRTDKCVHTLGHHKYWVRTVHCHEDTFSIATGSWDNTVKLIDMRRPSELLQDFRKHTNFVYSVRFHPSGKYLASGSADRKVRIYDLVERKVMYKLEDHTDWVRGVSFSPDGRYLASGSHDKKVILWNFPLGKFFYVQKDTDEEERIEYLMKKLSDGNDEEESENIKKVEVGGSCVIHCFKSFFLL